MRTIKQQNIPQVGDDAKFPNGQIKNEDGQVVGTPVVREIYGDPLANIYAIIRDAGIEFTETEDSETTQHQLLDALKVFSNSLNDLRQVLTVNGNTIAASFDFDNLPDNYIFFGILTGQISSINNYTITGTGEASKPLTLDSDIPASSIVLAILNPAGSTFINLSALISSGNEIHTNFGTPLSFNESSEMLYLSNGRILTEYPKSHNVQQIIQDDAANVNLRVIDAVLFKERLLCFVIDESNSNYEMYSFLASNLEQVEGKMIIPINNASDNKPYMYCDGDYLYFTNSSNVINNQATENSLGRFVFDTGALTLVAESAFNLDNNFLKTTNAVVSKDNQRLLSLIDGDLKSFPLNGGPRVDLGFYNTINGVIFKFTKFTYYSNGSVANKWNYN